MADKEDFELSDAERRMEACISVFKGDLGSLRTGRASAGLLEAIEVEAYGARTRLSRVASISVVDSRTLSVSVWDAGLVKAVDAAIRGSKLGLNPIINGEIVRVPIPELNAERRKELIKIGHKYAEKARIVIRNIRRDLLSKLKNLEDANMGEDEIKRCEGSIQLLTDEYISGIDKLLSVKERDLLQV